MQHLNEKQKSQLLIVVLVLAGAMVPLMIASFLIGPESLFFWAGIAIAGLVIWAKPQIIGLQPVCNKFEDSE